MAEIVGLAASIVQLGGAGIELSKSLYTFVSSAVRAESEISDLAGDVKLTCSALERVGQTLKSEDTKSALTQRAVSDAAEIKQRCESVFAEISGIIEKRWKVDGNGKRNLSLLGKASWPLKEQKVELLRRRLDSLKFSLSLLLSVLQLAHEQARGKLDADLEKERYTVRELHKQRQRALQREQALEEKLKRLELHQDVTASATTVAAPLQSAAPTIANIATNVIVSHPQVTANDAAMIGIHSTDSDTSDADATSTDDKGEHFTLAELALCASHIEDLLKRITDLQKGLQTGQLVKHHRKRRMHKTYLRICRKIESNFLVTSTSSPTAPLPPSRANNHRFPPKLIVKPDRINCGVCLASHFDNLADLREHTRTYHPDWRPPRPRRSGDDQANVSFTNSPGFRPGVVDGERLTSQNRRQSSPSNKAPGLNAQTSQSSLVNVPIATRTPTLTPARRLRRPTTLIPERREDVQLFSLSQTGPTTRHGAIDSLKRTFIESASLQSLSHRGQVLKERNEEDSLKRAEPVHPTRDFRQRQYREQASEARTSGRYPPYHSGLRAIHDFEPSHCSETRCTSSAPNDRRRGFKRSLCDNSLDRGAQPKPCNVRHGDQVGRKFNIEREDSRSISPHPARNFQRPPKPTALDKSSNFSTESRPKYTDNLHRDSSGTSSFHKGYGPPPHRTYVLSDTESYHSSQSDEDAAQARRRRSAIDAAKHVPTAAGWSRHVTPAESRSQKAKIDTATARAQCNGDRYGDEWLRMRHHHPTRLSDVLSESDISISPSTIQGPIGGFAAPGMSPTQGRPPASQAMPASNALRNKSPLNVGPENTTPSSFNPRRTWRDKGYRSGKPRGTSPTQSEGSYRYEWRTGVMPGTTGITYFKRPEHGPLGDMGNTGSDKQSLQIIEDPLQDLRTTGSYLREVVRSRSFSPAERTSTPEVPSGERWGTLHERSEALAFQQHPADNSPRQSIAQSIDKQPEMHHGAFPVHDDMLPEIGYGQDNESDTSTNPSIIQGPLGGGDGYFDQIEDRPLPFQEAPCTSGARTDFDYSGDGYGEEWVGMRHHHPTRLDDLSSEHETSPGSETTKGHIGSATPPVLQPRASPSEVRDLTSSALVGATLRGPASSLPGDTSVRTIRHTKAGTEGHQRGAGYAGKMKIEFEPRSDDNPIFSPTHCVDGFARKHQGSVAESISDVDMAGEEDEVDIVDVLLMQWIKPVLREPDRA